MSSAETTSPPPPDLDALEAHGEIRRKDFGLGFGPLGTMLGDVVKIELDLEFVEPA